MKRRVRALTAVWCAVAACVWCVDAADVDFPKAVAEAQEANDVAAINRLCNQWATAAPGDERPRLILGRTLVKAGMTDRALEQFELAAEANPLSPAPRCEIGRLFLNAGDGDAAMKEFSEVLRHHHGHLPAQLGCVRAQLAKGDANGALAAARRAVQANPDSASVKAALGECLWRLGKPGEAKTQLKAALGADPENADALFGWARALQSEGKEREAAEQWQRFLAREPSGPRAERVRNGWVVLSEERLPRACRGYPRWSPDARRIMFGYGRLRSIELDSKAITDVREPGNEKLYVHDWSPDGRSLVCRRLMPDRRSEVFLYDLAPDGTLQLVGDGPIGEAAMGRFSPDGTKVALSGGVVVRDGRRIPVGLAVFDLQAGRDAVVPWGNKERLSRNQGAWGPDSRTLVFHAHGEPDHSDRQLFLAVQDGTAPPLQITDNGAMNVVPCIAPDGRSVAFETDAQGAPATIFLVRAEGVSDPVPLAQGKTPSWSPDGRRLALDTPRGILIVRLGGLGLSPVGIAARRAGATLSVTVTSRSEEAQQVGLRWEFFDDDSFRVGLPGETEESIDLEPGAGAELILEVPPEDAPKVRTAKIRALNQAGAGAVALVDWAQEGG